MSDATNRSVRTVDQNELRTNQVLAILMLLSAYLLDNWHLVAIQCGIFLLTALLPPVGPYVLLYRFVVRPLGIVKPDVRVDNPEAHRFATSVGIVVSAVASYLLFRGVTAVGWGLVWLIIVLGGIALSGWCAGCFFYYMLNRLGVRGAFRYGPLPGVFPGARPPRR